MYPDLLYLAFIFFVFALILAAIGPKFGLGGSGTAMQIAYVFIAVFFVLLILGLLGIGSGGNSIFYR